VIIIAVRDTAGACLTDEIADAIKALGFAADLSFEKGLKKQYHHTYIGVIDRGQVICETLSKQREPSYYTATRDGILYEVVSKAYIGNVASIKIDGVDYATNRRGLNIAVFDPIAKTLIDSVCFDTHASTLYCSRIEEIIVNHLSELNGVSAAGYSVAQYLIDKQIKSAVVYTEERYWQLAEPIVVPLVLQKEIRMKGIYAEKPFIRTSAPEAVPPLNASTLDEALIDADCVALIIIPDPLLPPKLAGLKVIQLNELLMAMADWVFEDRVLISFMSRNPGITMVCFSSPRFPTKNRSENEQNIAVQGIDYPRFWQALIAGKFINNSYAGFDFTPSDVLEMQTSPRAYYDSRNLRVLEDKRGKMVNCIDGHRVTCLCRIMDNFYGKCHMKDLML
jgi:hypothetical protein